jgi:hypothetical protein
MFLKKLLCNHLKEPLDFIRNIYGDEINYLNGRSLWKCKNCGRELVRDYLFESGKISDGYHTFDELYHHRAVLFAVICSQFKDRSWKSLHHDDPEQPMYNGMFIVGIDTPEGQASYHYDIKPYWDMFDVKVLDKAPPYDGYTPEDSIKRISSLIKL